MEGLLYYYGKYITENTILGPDQLDELRAWFEPVQPDEVQSLIDAKNYLAIVRRFRETNERNLKHNGANFQELLSSLLSVGEDGVYSNNLRFIFELIQNVDDCTYESDSDRTLVIHFDFNHNQIVLRYNETGFTPFNIFAITGIAEAAKNISAAKNEIGEKGIGFKSVFGVSDMVKIRSGWFSFALSKEHFTIPISTDADENYCHGTEMILEIAHAKAEAIYREIAKQYCNREALFSRNPLLFLNKLTKLKLYYDSWRRMEFSVSRPVYTIDTGIQRNDHVVISADLHDHSSSGIDIEEKHEIECAWWTLPVSYDKKACVSRYGKSTKIGDDGGKKLYLHAVLPYPEDTTSVGNGALYSFLPTQLKLTVPMALHVPFKLDASREFVHPQENNLWFTRSCSFLSELLDYVLSDWCKTVKENIVRYLSGTKSGVFAINNGKELCLSEQKQFEGAHFLSLPVFHTANDRYCAANDVFCFEQGENPVNQELLCKLLGIKKELFIPPEDFKIAHLGISTQRNIYSKLFKRALSASSITKDALNFLDSVEYEYKESSLSQIDKIEFAAEQVEEIARHAALFTLLQRISGQYISKGMRPTFKISETGVDIQTVSSALYDDFQSCEAPQRVDDYLKYSGNKCILLDIDDTQYLPCHNVLVLPRHNSLSSFADLCSNIDSRDTFAIRIKLRQASDRLNEYEQSETMSAAERLRELENTRLIVKDSLGKDGYRSYIDLILKSGSDRGRFIQELLQNADDCNYPENAVPSFSLFVRNGKLITEYNEVGFTFANVRSITAIGESTKNKLLNGDYRSIGEKGVGFKTIFAVASEVGISSGDFNFILTDREPTIPRRIKIPDNKVLGTRMDISLKGSQSIPAFNAKNILELCLCLRKLQNININGHAMTIKDKGDKRTITIDKKEYSFTRLVYPFVVSDAEAIASRENGLRQESPNQQIVCYIPERNEIWEYYLYSGLPTKHKLRIPLVIDAPFALTTSREEIEVGDMKWNAYVRKEMYSAILKVMELLRESERTAILRFARFVPRLMGNVRSYVNDISDSDFLRTFDFLSVLRQSKIFSTYDPNVFVAPNNSASFRYPTVVNYLFDKGDFGGVIPCTAINAKEKEYESAFNALGMEPVSFEVSFRIIGQYAEQYIEDSTFRSLLYDFLKEAPREMAWQVKELNIIPVLGKTVNSTSYIKWKDNSIFVKKGATVSPANYYILNENILEKSICERITGENINELNEEWERNRYNDELRAILHGNDVKKIYHYLLLEYNKRAFHKYNSLGVLLEFKDSIPLKNQSGKITDSVLFICNKPLGYFPVPLIQDITVATECLELAKFIKCDGLDSLHYEDFYYYEELDAEDVESLMDDYFTNSEEILRGFYQSGQLSEKLLLEYGLEYLAMGSSHDIQNDMYPFPEKPLTNPSQLRKHVTKLLSTPIRIVPVKVERTVQKGISKDGTYFDLGMNDAREGALSIYTPEGMPGRCFCQMCHRIKPYRLIEVNNIEIEPRLYFPQMRIALCLECSKRFEYLRSNQSIREAYLREIKTTTINAQGKIDVPVGSEEKITFTAEHLAEIQEILLRKSPNEAITRNTGT